MKRTVISLVFIFACSISVAGEGTENSHEIQSLLNDFRQVLDGEEQNQSLKPVLKQLATAEGLKDWVAKYNFKKMGVDVYRLYHMKSTDPRFRKHVANLAFIFPASHLIETMFGPVTSSISASMGWPTSVTAGLGTVGAVISVPGLDPLCILIYSAYPLPKVQNSITHLREKSSTILGFVGRYSEVASMLKWARANLRTEGNFNISADDFSLDIYAESKIRSPSSTPLMQLIWSGSDRKFVRSVLLSPEALSLDRQKLQKLYKFLPLNVRIAMTESISYLDGIGPMPFYLQSIEIDRDGGLLIQWKDRSVISSAKMRDCHELLTDPASTEPQALQ